jgi:hypothetical protein
VNRAEALEVLGDAGQTVLRTEQDGQVDVRRLVEQLGGRAEAGIDRRGVRQQADAQTAHGGAASRQKHLKARSHR